MSEQEREDPRGRWWPYTWGSLAVAGGLGALELLRGRFQHRRTFVPERYPDGAWNSREAGLEKEDRWFETRDGVRLHGWWLPGGERRRYSLLFCHGQTGALGSHVGDLQQILDHLEAAVFAFDYRGYGRSEGAPSERGLYLDVRAAHRHLTEEIGEAPGRILLFGHSLGGAVAIDAALDVPVAGLIAQATFTQIRDMARAFYPGLPLHLVTRNRFRSVEKIARIEIPKLLVHGERDEKVPPEIGEELFAAAAEPKERLLVPEAGHSDLFSDAGPSYWEAVDGFCRRCVGEG